MYLCVRGIDFASFYDLRFGNVPTVKAFFAYLSFYHFIMEDDFIIILLSVTVTTAFDIQKCSL